MVKKKLKIVHLRPFFDPETGYELMTLPKKIARLGHKVYVISSNVKNPLKKNMEIMKDKQLNNHSRMQHYSKDGVEVYRLPPYFHYRDFVLVKNLRKILETIKPDIVHGFGSRSGITFQAARYKQELGYKLTIFEDQYDFAGSNYLNIGAQLAKYEYLLIRRWICQYVLNRADIIYESTNEGINFLKKYFVVNSKKVNVMPYAADPEFFYFSNKDRIKIRNKFGITSKTFVIATFGSQIFFKNTEFYIKTLKKMIEKNFPVKLMIVGGGVKSYLQYLKKLVSDLDLNDYVIFIKNVDHQKMYQFYSATDLCVWNRCTTAIQEAMMCKVPVAVSSDVARTLHKFGKICYENNNITQFVNTVASLIKDQKKYKKLRNELFKMTCDYYDYNKRAKEYLSDYYRII